MTGASGSGRTEGEHGRLAAKQGSFSPRAGRGPAIARPVRSGRNAARHAALKRTATGSGPQPDRGRSGTGLKIDTGKEGQTMMTICLFLRSCQVSSLAGAPT